MSEPNHTENFIEKATVLSMIERPDCRLSFRGSLLLYEVDDFIIATECGKDEDGIATPSMYPVVRVEKKVDLGNISYTNALTLFSGDHKEYNELIPVSFASRIEISAGGIIGNIMRVDVERLVNSELPLKIYLSTKLPIRSFQIEDEDGNLRDFLDLENKDSSSWFKKLTNGDFVNICVDNTMAKPFVTMSISTSSDEEVIGPVINVNINNEKIHSIYLPKDIKLNPNLDMDLRNGKLEPLLNPPTVLTFTGRV